MSADVYWVDKEVWGEFEEKLAAAKEMLAGESVTGTQMDQMLMHIYFT